MEYDLLVFLMMIGSSVYKFYHVLIYIFLLQAGSINATSFTKSYQEWAYCQNALNGAMREDAFLCPVCSSFCHSIHIDGHRKRIYLRKCHGKKSNR